jgi:hypothetical protein
VVPTRIRRDDITAEVTRRSQRPLELCLGPRVERKAPYCHIVTASFTLLKVAPEFEM